MIPIVQAKYVCKAFLEEPNRCGNSDEPESFQEKWWTATVLEVNSTSFNTWVYVAFERFGTQTYRLFSLKEFCETYVLIDD